MGIKEQGQIFTPRHIVEDILEKADYKGKKILKKHVIDNSCGDGAFLIAFVEKYIDEYKRQQKTLEGISKDLETYIHGIEKDEKIYKDCIENLNKLLKEKNINKVNWDILNEDTLKVNKYDGKMDYVIGNPPYVRVHNLKEQYKNVKKYSFCDGGMVDLYIVFFEIGLRMLKKTGILCYITPNSFYNSVAGEKLRYYLENNKCLKSLVDLGHYQPFEADTYTAITTISNDKEFRKCEYYKYNLKTEKPEFISKMRYEDIFLDGKIILSTYNKRYKKYIDDNKFVKQRVEVKNGFATLNDNIFINEKFDENINTIDVIKASTGQWKKCIYPYDENGNLLEFNQLTAKTQEYLIKNKEPLTKNKGKLDSEWYGFGRSQAIKDVYKTKISINTTIKDINSIKLNIVEPGEGIYSGLYILTDLPYEIIEQKICCQNFIEYLEALNKCKSGGYYTISSKELATYLNYEIEEEIKMNNKEFLDVIKQSFYKYLETHARSTEKLKILHGTIAKDIEKRIGSEYKICSLGLNEGKEYEMQGKYTKKKTDITILKDNDVKVAIGLKFIMSNYSQNSNNYFENMLGETANIRITNKPYFQIIILPSILPYFEDGGIIKKYEHISEEHLKKYKNLSYDNPEEYKHLPTRTLFYFIDIPHSDSIKNKKNYKNYYMKNNELKIKVNNRKNDFGPSVIYNDYEKFIEIVCDTIKKEKSE